MQLTPNLGSKSRLAYAFFGALLIAAALLGPLGEAWYAIALGLVGAIVLLEGAVGF